MEVADRMTGRCRWGDILLKGTPNRHCEVSKGGILIRLEAGKIIVQNQTARERIVQPSGSEMGLSGPRASLILADALGPTLITMESLDAA